MVRDGRDTILVAATGCGKSPVLYTFATLTKKITLVLQIVPLTTLGQS
jgi:superfamily II DNA or RNA helicase